MKLTLTKHEMLDNHRSALCSFRISTNVDELDIPSLNWITNCISVLRISIILMDMWKTLEKPLSIFSSYILLPFKSGLQSNSVISHFAFIDEVFSPNNSKLDDYIYIIRAPWHLKERIPQLKLGLFLTFVHIPILTLKFGDVRIFFLS